MKTVSFAAIVALLVVIGADGVHASPPTNSQGYDESKVQGITSAVVDNLWEYTDFWWHRGEYPRIIALDRIITEADPHFLVPYSTGGWLMESLGNDSDAEKYYRLGATRNPDKSYAWFNLGFFYYNTIKDYPSAVKTFLAASNAPDSGINDWKMLAHSYERNNQLTQAVAIWQKLHVTYPDDGVVTHNLDKDQKALVASAQPTGL